MALELTFACERTWSAGPLSYLYEGANMMPIIEYSRSGEMKNSTEPFVRMQVGKANKSNKQRK